MKRLKSRPRVDTMRPQVRKKSSTLGHLIYFLLLSGVTGTFLVYMFGEMFIFRADGLVVQDQYKVEAPATLMVMNIFVEPGMDVEPGDPLLEVEMMGTQMQLAQLAERIGSLSHEQALERSRAREAERQIPAIRKQIATYTALLERKRSLLSRGLDVSAALDETEIALQELEKEYARLSTRAEYVKQDAHTLDVLRESYARIERMAGDGIIRARVAGRIGKSFVKPGAVALTGEELISIIHGKKYVIAYIDGHYKFSFRKGQKVLLTGEHVSDHGIVTDFLPFSETLPIEFHDTLTARRRSILARIDVEDSNAMVMDQGVQVALETHPFIVILRNLLAAAPTAEPPVQMSHSPAPEPQSGS